MIRVSGITLSPDRGDDAALTAALARLKIGAGDTRLMRIAKKSVDARDKTRIKVLYAVDIALIGDEAAHLARVQPRDAALVPQVERLSVPRLSRPLRPVVVGLGPCGLFAALFLARAGLRPLVLERGQRVAERARAVNRLFHSGVLDEQSNIQFGEGGAGTFSDGKLTTGTKSPLVREVLLTLHEFGAPDDILYLQRPHLGTDNLPKIVSSMRQEIERLGGEVRFGARLSDIRLHTGALRAVQVLQAGEVQEIACDRLILALGHSARDTQTMLHGAGLTMLAKPLSIGLRLEQRQEIINQAQYGAFAGHPTLPAAEYHLAHHTSSGRGVYTFCMCPGGRVVNAASEAGHLCVNGMSSYRRDGQNANAAILVDVRVEDFAGDSPLAGYAFQRQYEEKAFTLGGGGFAAPAQLAEDFIAGRPSRALKGVQPTLLPGILLGDLAPALPPFAVSALREALMVFDRKLKGFLSHGALLTGVETRSSSPLRVNRNEAMQGSIAGVFPAGEGAGMAGGIMSAAVDGLKAAMALAQSV